MDQGALLADNARISKELVEVQNKLELAEAVASEKVCFDSETHGWCTGCVGRAP
jgi:hypothetical protein